MSTLSSAENDAETKSFQNRKLNSCLSTLILNGNKSFWTIHLYLSRLNAQWT